MAKWTLVVWIAHLYRIDGRTFVPLGVRFTADRWLLVEDVLSKVLRKCDEVCYGCLCGIKANHLLQKCRKQVILDLLSLYEMWTVNMNIVWVLWEHFSR